MGSIIFFNGLPARATLNQEMSRVYVIKDKMGGRSSQKALRVLSPLPWDRFLRRGDESFLVFWRTVETSTNLLRGVIGLISTRNDYPNTVLDDVLSLRGSCTYTVPPTPPPDGKNFNLLQLMVWTTKELTHTLVYICFSFPCRHIIWRSTQSSGITFILKSSFHVVLIGL